MGEQIILRGSKNNKNLITIATRVSIVLVAISYLFDHPGIPFILSNIFMDIKFNYCFNNNLFLKKIKQNKKHQIFYLFRLPTLVGDDQIDDVFLLSK